MGMKQEWVTTAIRRKGVTAASCIEGRRGVSLRPTNQPIEASPPLPSLLFLAYHLGNFRSINTSSSIAEAHHSACATISCHQGCNKLILRGLRRLPSSNLVINQVLIWLPLHIPEQLNVTISFRTAERLHKHTRTTNRHNHLP
jgi:hypothetical protein